MKKKILGMGNAVLDIVTSVSDDFLNEKKLKKGSMSLVDEESSESILKEIKIIKTDSGGSVANTIVGISMLGIESFFCGKVKKDKLGNEFISDMKDSQTSFLCEQSHDGLPTARCIVFVTPDGERSMQTFLGASTTLSEEDVEEKFFDDIDFLLIEGYLWSSNSARKAIEKAVSISKKEGIKVIFSLSDSNLVQMFKKDFLDFIGSDVDILIGNDEEYNVLLGDVKEEDFVKKNNTDILVKTMGEKGAEIIQNNTKNNVSSPKVNNVLDTTGAGDMFAAGFLFKLLEGNDPINAAKFGCKTASIIIQQYGARPNKKSLQGLED